jgi:Enoyl-(Acyl carrier protein) reductase
MLRLAQPEEFANAALVLASDESSLMTGSDMVVDNGGMEVSEGLTRKKISKIRYLYPVPLVRSEGGRIFYDFNDLRKWAELLGAFARI